MSTLKTNNVQIGQSLTATQNFTLSVPDTPDGSMKIARGNQGATTQDILTVDSSGNVNIAGGLGIGSGPTNPVSPAQGTLWYNTTSNTLLVYNGSNWTSAAASLGDITITSNTLSAPEWLPADGSEYLQSSYPALYSSVGKIGDGPTEGSTIFGSKLDPSAIELNMILKYVNNQWVKLEGRSSADALLYTSEDGIIWTFVTSFPYTGNNSIASTTSANTEFIDLAYLNGKYFLHSGSNNTPVYVSDTLAGLPNGSITATLLATDKAPEQILRARYVNGYYVLCGWDSANALIWYSTDAVNWTSSNNIQGSHRVTDIAYVSQAGQYFALTTSGRVYKSSNISFNSTSNVTISANADYEYHIEYIPEISRYCIFSGTTTASGGGIWTSTDGATFTRAATSPEGVGDVYFYYNSEFYVGIKEQASGTVSLNWWKTNDQGATWSSAITEFEDSSQFKGFYRGRFGINTSTGLMLTTNYTNTTGTGSGSLYRSISGPGNLHAMTNILKVFYQNSKYYIFYSDPRVFESGNITDSNNSKNCVYSTTDFTSFTLETLPQNTTDNQASLRAYNFDGDTNIVFMYPSGKYHLTSDMSTFNFVTPPWSASDDWKILKLNGKYFAFNPQVAAAETQQIYVSTDLLSWTLKTITAQDPPGITSNSYGILTIFDMCYINGYYVAAAGDILGTDRASLYWSTNEFTSYTNYDKSDFNGYWHSIVPSGTNKITAVGYGSTISKWIELTTNDLLNDIEGLYLNNVVSTYGGPSAQAYRSALINFNNTVYLVAGTLNKTWDGATGLSFYVYDSYLQQFKIFDDWWLYGAPPVNFANIGEYHEDSGNSSKYTISLNKVTIGGKLFINSGTDPNQLTVVTPYTYDDTTKFITPIVSVTGANAYIKAQ